MTADAKPPSPLFATPAASENSGWVQSPPRVDQHADECSYRLGDDRREVTNCGRCRYLVHLRDTLRARRVVWDARRQVTCLRCGSTGPRGWCSWCDAPVQEDVHV